jgi:hypothetical protein
MNWVLFRSCLQDARTRTHTHEFIHRQGDVTRFPSVLRTRQALCLGQHWGACYHCQSRKTVSIAYSEYVSVALVVQHAMRMRHTVMAFTALQYFSTLSHKRHCFRKKLLNTKSVFWFALQLLSETFLSKRITDRVVIKQMCSSACEVPLLLADCNLLDIF